MPGNFAVEYVYRLLDKYSGPLKAINRNTTRFRKTIKKTKQEVDRFNRKLKQLGRSMMSIGRGAMLRITAPLTLIGTLATVSFAKLEKGLINVNNLLSKAELKKYGGKLDNMQNSALGMGYSIDDVNKGLFDTISALGANTDAFETFQIAQRLAIAGNTELGTAVKGIQSAMNTYAAEGMTATHAANAFFSAQVKGVTTVRELTDNVGAVAPIARAAGTGLNELLATMTALTLGGLRTDNATTALRGAFNALVKPQENAAKVMDQLGIMYGGANIKVHGITESFRTMKVAMEKYGIDAVAKAIPNIRAFTAVTSMSDRQLLKVKETIKKIESDMKTGDGMARAFGDQYKSLAWTFARAKGAMTRAFKNFVKVFAPELKLILSLITKFIYKLAELPRPIKKLVLTLIALTAILPIVIMALGLLAFMMPYLATAFGWLKVAGIATLVALGPYVWLITAIVILVGSLIKVFYEMYQNSETLRGSFGVLAGVFTPIIDGVKMLFKWIGKLWGAFSADDASTWKTWGDNFARMIYFIASGINGIITAIKIVGSMMGALSMGEGITGAMRVLQEDYPTARDSIDRESNIASQEKIKRDQGWYKLPEPQDINVKFSGKVSGVDDQKMEADTGNQGGYTAFSDKYTRNW